ncbi:cytochrome P450 [Xylariaceae sp. FL1272]|nr:cytochrome P450 [Xylariaceae sp. FL1272]
MLSQIPGPWPLPIIGNLRDINLSNILRDMANLADVYGPIYKLHLGGEDIIIVTSRELYPIGFLKELRSVAADGLFTAYPGEECWGIAHRTLSSAFATAPMKNMFPEMLDVASQLVLKWARFGPEHQINAVQDFTRLTIDTLALCAMDTRLNSFYTDQVPAYVQAMGELLLETQVRPYRPWWLGIFMRETNRKFDENNRIVHSVAEDIVARRRADPSRRKKDLVDAMLYGVDPKTEKQMSDTVIIDNMIAFLIAGHETTAGLLSFMLAFLMKNQEAYSTLQNEIDQESLRLEPPSGGWAVTCMNSDDSALVILGNRWEIKPGQTIFVSNRKLHRDPAVWGDDVEEFKPERMLGETFSKLPKNSLKAFGNGQRACIGRAFALQEATLATALLLQKFDFQLVDEDYEVVAKEKLALKPEESFMYAKLRPHVDILSLQRDMFGV